MATGINAYWRLYNKTSTDIEADKKAIMQTPKYACTYAIWIIEGRWLEAEQVIMQDSEYAYRYARYIIGGRWPEAEPVIMQSLPDAYFYAERVIRGRWEEAEAAFMQDKKWGKVYFAFLNELKCSLD